jgi:hypothetical protein
MSSNSRLNRITVPTKSIDEHKKNTDMNMYTTLRYTDEGIVFDFTDHLLDII